jgi:hypothetical protein
MRKLFVCNIKLQRTLCVCVCARAWIAFQRLFICNKLTSRPTRYRKLQSLPLKKLCASTVYSDSDGWHVVKLLPSDNRGIRIAVLVYFSKVINYNKCWDLKLSRWHDVIKSSRAVSCVNSLKKHNVSGNHSVPSPGRFYYIISVVFHIFKELL